MKPGLTHGLALVAAALLVSGCAAGPAPQPPAPSQPTSSLPSVPATAVPSQAVTALAAPPVVAGELCRGSADHGSWTITCTGSAVAGVGYDLVFGCTTSGGTITVELSLPGSDELLTASTAACGQDARNTALLAGQLRPGQRPELQVSSSPELSDGWAVVVPAWGQ